jgi:GT2 family glycosyltransferase
MNGRPGTGRPMTDVLVRTRSVHVVIVAYNSADHLPDLLAGLGAEAGESGLELQVCVVDNGSTDGGPELVESWPGADLVRPGANLGYAGGINVCLEHAPADVPVLVLNPDLRLHPGALTALLDAADADPSVGVVVPLIEDDDGVRSPSLRREPSLPRAVLDALLGARAAALPGTLSEMVWQPGRYARTGDVDWATGAAMLITPQARRRVGRWDDERFFLYSEETDYCRRVRDAGLRVRFTPAARVQHSGGGSGTSPELAALMTVNKVRYFAKYHSRPAAAAFRAAQVLGAALRSRDAGQRLALGMLLRRSRWAALPGARR